jgi:hypothetical protein
MPKGSFKYAFDVGWFDVSPTQTAYDVEDLGLDSREHFG